MDFPRISEAQIHRYAFLRRTHPSKQVTEKHEARRQDGIAPGLIPRTYLLTLSLLAFFGLVATSGNIYAASEVEDQSHSHHHSMNSDAVVKRTLADYTVPSVSMVRNDGSKATFPQEIDDGRPVILNFVYTSCTTICPITSLVFSQAQKKLSADLGNVHMMSISIDPEYDTPERLTAFAKKYDASARWQHYTGSIEASIEIQKAFNAYRGDKMNHIPLTFIRSTPGKPWVRLDGFVNSDQIVHELHQMASGQ